MLREVLKDNVDTIYFPSGMDETVWLWEGDSHAEDQVAVKRLGAVMWGPLEDTDAPN